MLIYVVSNQDPIKHDISIKWFRLFFHGSRPERKLKIFTQREHSGKLTALVLIDFAVTVAQFLKQGNHSGLTEGDILKRPRRKEMDELRQYYLREKKLSIIEIWECQCKHRLRANDENKSFAWSTFSPKWALIYQKLLSNIQSAEILGYVQCVIRVPDNLIEKLVACAPISKNTYVSRSDIVEFTRKYAEDNKVLTQPRKKLKSRF